MHILCWCLLKQQWHVQHDSEINFTLLGYYVQRHGAFTYHHGSWVRTSIPNLDIGAPLQASSLRKEGYTAVYSNQFKFHEGNYIGEFEISKVLHKNQQRTFQKCSIYPSWRFQPIWKLGLMWIPFLHWERNIHMLANMSEFAGVLVKLHLLIEGWPAMPHFGKTMWSE